MVMVLVGDPLGEEAPDHTEDEAYEHLDYLQMREKLKNLNTVFPDVVRLESADAKYGIPYLATCDDDNDCVLDIVTVTDHLTGPEDKV